MTTSDGESENIIHILSSSSEQGFSTDHIDTGIYSEITRVSYFTPDRITVELGNFITIVNGSDSSLTNHDAFVLYSKTPDQLRKDLATFNEKCSYTLDNRINSGKILPEESATATFDEIGFYRSTDPGYPRMTISAYSFNGVDGLYQQGDGNLGN